ncbi:BACON domain-containing protein [Streptomyces sp. SCSIO ZS0520]|uniref:BACON domain-containing protein n=1 Tax=Streptomyces sp. SCSIO ZS0520 TaxID=2892996 RepID=UPI0021D8B62F|nr:hypothetical protein [Streptomyces sp. SCSIO ZS0520]
MSSRQPSPSQSTAMPATGAHRAHRDARHRAGAHEAGERPPAHDGRRPTPGDGDHHADGDRRPVAADRHEAHLDGLFTYCLSVLCDHELALAALADVLALARRRQARGPALDSEQRAWLYSLARWSCLRELAQARRRRQGAHASGRRAEQPAARPGPRPGSSPVPEVSEEAERQHRRELALLAWPEAAGTSPEQREALELSVRHRLSPHEVAAVLGLDRIATRELLASAACEVERTRAALAVVEKGTCPSVARLTGDHQLLLGTALRRELVRHVDDCPRCRRTAERAAPGTWPGTSAAPALPVVAAPRAALHALPATARGRHGVPRFDRRGFPMDPKDRAARRDRIRSRALTTTVVATVVAAPVLALWAAYRGAPLTGEGQGGHSASADERSGPGDPARAYENAGNARATEGWRFAEDEHAPEVSVEVVSAGARPSHSQSGPGRLTVEARPGSGLTLLTLRASGGAPVHWSAAPSARWLLLSRSSGTLRPGESVTVRVYVDRTREPGGPWRATVALEPSGALVSIEGYGRWRPPPTRPTRPGTPPPHGTRPPSTPPTRPTGRPSTLPATAPPTSKPPQSPTPSASNTGPAQPDDSSPPADSGSPGSPGRPTG